MDQGIGQDFYHASSSGSIDKSRVLNVKPMRILYPVFQSPPNLPSSSQPQGAAPFLSVSPTGPFPPGVVPFYPFCIPPESQAPSSVPNQAKPFGFTTPIRAAVPLSLFQTPQPQVNGNMGVPRTGFGNGAQSSLGEEDGHGDNQSQSARFVSGFSMHVIDAEETSTVKRQKGKTMKKMGVGQVVKFPLPDIDFDSIVASIPLNKFRRDDGDQESVGYLLMIFDLLRRKISQIDDSKDINPGSSRRPDLRAGTILMSKGIRTNAMKRIGTVPGVKVGDIFYFRMEMCLSGLHAQVMGGIDYMTLKLGLENEPVAISIVSSGGYEDNTGDGDVLIYSGQGGNVHDNRSGKEISDQKLERGNLALEKSLHRGNEVRVIRGLQDSTRVKAKWYVYDGLYKIQESWLEQGKSGCNIFKYKFIRLPGQTETFKMWKSIQQWKEGITSRTGVILPDLTSGAEKLSVSLVNDVDDEKGPAYFTYVPSLNYLMPMNPAQSSSLCGCKSGCHSGDPHCSCIQKNGGCLPYTSYGILVNQKNLIYECGPSCACPPTCWNRASQGGLKVHLEVYKTSDKGWGLRSLDPIRAGAFVCEYAGEVIEIRNQIDNEYIFDCRRRYEPQEVLPGDFNEGPAIPFPVVINAKNGGNVARFMNHSCSPNVFWQPILQASNNESFLHIGFFAIRHIPPMTELTYDYGIIQTDYLQESRKKCLCGAPKCRGYFF